MGPDRHAPELISVLMPVYNAARYLAEAVESVLGQTYGQIELVVIDDGSTDGSRAILEGYARRDPRVRLVSRPNTGYTVALNEALGLASGSLVARMDADDVSMPDRFRRQADFLRDHPDHVAVGCRVLLIDFDGGPLVEAPFCPEHDAIVGHLLNGLGGVIPHPGLMARASAMRALGGYRARFEPVEDLDLYLRLAELGRLANHPDVLLHYRQHLRSVSHLRHREQLGKARLSVIEARERRGLAVAPDFELEGWDDPSGPDRWHWWFWSALGRGRKATARRLALEILKNRPFSAASWRVAFCAARGR